MESLLGGDQDRLGVAVVVGLYLLQDGVAGDIIGIGVGGVSTAVGGVTSSGPARAIVGGLGDQPAGGGLLDQQAPGVVPGCPLNEVRSSRVH